MNETADRGYPTEGGGLLIRAALDRVGLAFVSEEHAASHLASGPLVRVRVREDWCPTFNGLFLRVQREVTGDETI